MAENKNPFTYPKTRKDETCFDNPNKVADPYRWLEDADSQDTANWVKEQNDITFDYLAKCEHREILKKTVTDLFNYPKIGCPFRNGKNYYYFKNTGLQNQSILYRQPITETPLQYDEKAEIFFDPNKLSGDGTSAINTYSFSESGRYFAYAIAKSGSDWCEIHVKDAVSGEDLKDTLQWVKFSGISWTHDDKGFFYSRFPKPNSLNTETKAGTEVDSNHFHKLYYHVVGTPQEADVLVYENKEEKNYMFNASVTEDGRFLEIYVSRSCEEVNLFHYLDLTHWDVEKVANGAQLPVVKLIDEFDASYNLVANDGELFYFVTNHQAPRKKVICIDLKSPQKENWVDIVAQTEEVISGTTCVHQDYLVVKKMKDVKDVLFLYKLNKASGALVKEIPLPTLGTITSLSSKQKYSELFFNFTSFTFPGSVYRYDVATDSVTLFLETKPQALTFSLSDFEVEQVFYPSKDQTKIPMFIVYKKGLKKDGKNPTLLYGYGGFNISIQPSFSISRLIFMHHFNGVLAVANIRGGGEYGEDWHQQGIKDKKQNCFDDFCAAAEWLVANGYTAPSQIAIQGGSNGGLLVGACMNQRPDLFGCCIAQVGVLDMLRFHKFTIGHYWTSDYGSADEKEGFEYLIKYSPLHNVRKDADYPALLLTTGDHDDRVVPLHSFKFISAVQDIVGSKPTQTKPLLIRVETKAGHGAGKPTTKVIEETADIFAFIAKSLNLTWRD